MGRFQYFWMWIYAATGELGLFPQKDYNNPRKIYFNIFVRLLSSFILATFITLKLLYSFYYIIPITLTLFFTYILTTTGIKIFFSRQLLKQFIKK